MIKGECNEDYRQAKTCICVRIERERGREGERGRERGREGEGGGERETFLCF